MSTGKADTRDVRVEDQLPSFDFGVCLEAVGYIQIRMPQYFTLQTYDGQLIHSLIFDKHLKKISK